jgi:hypothetical protein
MPFLTKGKTNWKYILVVVILSALVGGGILGYLRNFQREIIFLTQFPEIKKPEKVETEKPKIEEETANWKIYRNEEYGFEIKYPEVWEVKEYSKRDISFLAPPLAEFPDVQDVMIQVKILENPEELSTRQWLTNKINDGTIIPVGEISDFTTNNIKGIKLIEVEYIPTKDEMGKPSVSRFVHESAYICKNNLVYKLAVATGSPPFPYFNQILSLLGF